MIRTQPHRRFQATLLAWIVGLSLHLGSVAHAGISYDYTVTVNTSGVSGVSGYVDLQFNPADSASTPGATATVSQFTGFSGSLGTPTFNGDATGDPTSSLVLNNTSGLNSYMSSITFGSSLSFLLKLSGPAFTETSSNGSTFLFALYNSAMTPLNGTLDPTAVQIDLVPFGISPGVSLSTSTGPAYSGGPNANVTAVPEASTTIMLGLLALAGVITARRGKRQAA